MHGCSTASEEHQRSKLHSRDLVQVLVRTVRSAPAFDLQARPAAAQLGDTCVQLTERPGSVPAPGFMRHSPQQRVLGQPAKESALLSGGRCVPLGAVIRYHFQKFERGGSLQRCGAAEQRLNAACKPAQVAQPGAARQLRLCQAVQVAALQLRQASQAGAQLNSSSSPNSTCTKRGVRRKTRHAGELSKHGERGQAFGGQQVLNLELSKQPVPAA